MLLAHVNMQQRKDIRNLVRQVDAVRDYSESLSGDMAIDRGGPEDAVYRALMEICTDPVQLHTMFLAAIDDEPTRRRALSRLPGDIDTRSRVLISTRNLVRSRIDTLVETVASHPDSATTLLLELERESISYGNLVEDITRARSPPAPEASSCPICFDDAIGNCLQCSTCNKRVHTACLDEYRASVGGEVPCPTCRGAFN